MSGAGKSDRVAAALQHLRRCNHYFQFDDQERVVEVAIYDATGADEIAAHVGNLHDVRKLTFDRTDISDKGLADLADLAEVREFSLQSPNISALGLSRLANMTSIVRLVLDSPRMGRHELEAISRLQSLRKLSIYGGIYADGDVAPLAKLNRLEELETSENERLNGTYARFLTGLPLLKNLSPGTSITDGGLSCISQLRLLTTLFLEGLFSDVGLLKVEALQRLETLYVTSEQATDESVGVIAALPKLRRLGLSIPRLTDSGALRLARCRALQYLVVFRSALTEAGRKMLRDAMPDCDIQLLDNRPVQDDED